VNAARPLLVMLVHGIGPQNAPAQGEFLDRLRDATTRRLGEIGKAGLASRLVLDRADWSHLFPERIDWLKHLFPSYANLRFRSRRTLVMILWLALFPAITALGTAGGMTLLRPSALGWLVGTVAGLAVAILAAWSWIMPLFPWGHLLMFGRTFEANTASDVILYGSDEPRRQIRDVVLAKIQPYLSSKYALAGGARECLPVVLIGHSLGSVVVYDLLLGISARMGARKVTAAQRELSAVTQQLRGATGGSAAGRAAVGGAEPEADPRAHLDERHAFLQRADDIETTVCPVGMITLGSPIALFLFRKPSILARRDLWKDACPPPFQATGLQGRLRWRWQNFWHPSDLVAHRLEPLFDQGYPPSGGRLKFVEDVKTWAPARDPVSAHATYWTNPAVLRRISEHLADVLVNV